MTTTVDYAAKLIASEEVKLETVRLSLLNEKINTLQALIDDYTLQKIAHQTEYDAGIANLSVLFATTMDAV